MLGWEEKRTSTKSAQEKKQTKKRPSERRGKQALEERIFFVFYITYI